MTLLAPWLRLAAVVSLIWSAAQAAEVRRDVEYGRAGNESLKLDHWVPDGAGPHPAVILVHGGGWSTGDKDGGARKNAFMVPMQAPLEKAGFAWISINYRLAPKHRYPACIEDVETAIRWVKAHAKALRVDPERLALAGESAGGHLVALAAVRADAGTRVAAVVPFYAPLDLEAMVPADGPLRPGFKNLTGRDTLDDTARAVLREASPMRYVKKGLPPFLLVHGTADTLVPIAQSEMFHARLKELGVASDLLVVPKAGHGMLGWKTIAPDYQANVVGWLTRTLAP